MKWTEKHFVVMSLLDFNIQSIPNGTQFERGVNKMMFVLEINGVSIPGDVPPNEQYMLFDSDDLPDDGEGIGDNELWFIAYINMCLESCKALPLLTNIVRIADDQNAVHCTYIHIHYDCQYYNWKIEYMDYDHKNPFGWVEKTFYRKKDLFQFLLKGGVWNG